MNASPEPAPGPAHQCLNMSCGCNDLVSAGPCSEWCSAHTVEAAAVVRGEAQPEVMCGCGHALCRENRSQRGTAERGLS